MPADFWFSCRPKKGFRQRESAAATGDDLGIDRREGFGDILMATESEKDRTICFQTTSYVLRAVEEIAQEENRSVSETVEEIVFRHLQGKKALNHNVNRRRSERKQVAFPSYIGDPRWQRRDFVAGMVTDISLGGVRVSIPAGTRVKIESCGEEAQFSVIFTPPDGLWPIHLKCRPRWVAETGEAVQIGGSLINPDLNAYRVLQKYLC